MGKKNKKQNTPQKLPSDTDFEQAFSVNSDSESEKTFQELFEESTLDRSLNKLLEAKRKNANSHQTISKKALLKRYPNPQDTLDLHGLTEGEAIDEVNSFLAKEKAKGTRTVRIITGKGLHSFNGPVLRNSIESLGFHLIRTVVLLSLKW